MLERDDPEAGHPADHEREALLPSSEPIMKSPLEDPYTTSTKSYFVRKQFAIWQLSIAFVAGLFACGIAQLAVFGPDCFSKSSGGGAERLADGNANVLAPPYVGSTEQHNFPPTSPTNAYPTLFPTSVGYAGGTPTGAEPAVIATAPSQPLHTGAPNLVVPESFGKKQHSKGFNLFQKWGNLSPWYTVPRTSFGLDSSPEAPETCRITGLHLLHRHGARYPTSYASYGGPSKLAGKLNEAAANWTATGELDFLNTWTHKLGEELLTPFGRQQLYDLGISMRLKYGFLLQNFTETNTIPVFRTESQDRMLYSALNFALGFFGYPLEGKYQQSITIEAPNFNNTLAPYDTCDNANDRAKAGRGDLYVAKWANIYLKNAHARINKDIKGFDFSVEDVFTMQQMCAYETVAIGYSKFCELFTEDEWEGFNYAWDLYFWYNSAFGAPVGRVQGIGWVKELVARLTHTPIKEHNTSTNSTLNDDPITFPLNQALYVDATHEVVVLNIITALNLTNFAANGPLPYTHIPENRSFRVAELAPFATNVQFQLLACDSIPGDQIRVIINDGVTPLTGIKGCPEQKDGMCAVDTFVKAQQEIIDDTDWNWECLGNWVVPPGPAWNTTTGQPPRKPSVM